MKTAKELIEDIIEQGIPDSYVADLEKGVEAGNYANSYTDEDLNTAIKKGGKSQMMRDPGYAAGYILGFFESYEINEIPDKYKNKYLKTLKGKFGKLAKQKGWID